MDFEKILQNEETLDPADWNAARELAHRMIDDAVDYLQNISKKPVWTATPEATKRLAAEPLPAEGTPVERIYDDFREHIFPFTKGNIHPRFFAWVQGNGTFTGALGDFLASVMNPNVTIGDHAAMHIDAQVVDWSRQIFGFPESAGGILLSGGSLANITAVAAARNAFDEKMRARGLYSSGGELTMYCSTETHSCLVKAAEMIGIGHENLRKIPVGADFRIKTDLLRAKIAEDRAAGKRPFCIVGNAGTVNTGAIDPLEELLAISKSEKVWFHVDGAFGSLGILDPELEPLLAPLREADSLAFDFHKWLYVNYECGCCILREKRLLRGAFALQPSYLLSHERGLAAGPDMISNFGMELSRGFKALKIWMSLREHGLEKYRRLIRQNIAQAFFLEKLVKNEPLLELLAPVTMNICVFRFLPKGQKITLEAANSLNKEILMQLHEQAVAAPSYTMIDGKYALRVCIVNHRTLKKDLRALIAGVVRIGQKTVAESFG